MRDYYSLLGVNPGASFKEIRMAYRREASKWHPDKNSSHDSTERMQLINEAHLILTDHEARARYDREISTYQNYMKAKDGCVNTESEYTFNDEILFQWVQNAKKQAKELTNVLIDDLVGIARVGTSAFYNKTKYWILVLILLNLILLMF
jgi:curved DNA-binding protein CbpA